MYHKVQRHPLGAWGEPALDASAFEEQCRFLARHANVLPLRELVERLRGGFPPPPRAVVITFDDGYRHNLVLAAPILAKYRLPATFFVASGLCGTDRWMWCFEIEEMSRRWALEDLCRGIGEPTVEEISRAPLPPRTRALVLVEYLKRRTPAERDPVLVELRRRRPLAPDDENRFLSWGDVRALAEMGFEIGSHTVSHPILPLLDAPEVEREVIEAKATIARETGRTPELFCYPNGDHSHQVREIVRRHHVAAVSVEKGDNPLGTDPYVLRRVGAPTHLSDLAYQLVVPARG